MGEKEGKGEERNKANWLSKSDIYLNPVFPDLVRNLCRFSCAVFTFTASLTLSHAHTRTRAHTRTHPHPHTRTCTHTRHAHPLNNTNTLTIFASLILTYYYWLFFCLLSAFLPSFGTSQCYFILRGLIFGMRHVAEFVLYSQKPN